MVRLYLFSRTSHLRSPLSYRHRSMPVSEKQPQQTCIAAETRKTPRGQDISLKVRNLLHDRLHFPSRLLTPVPLRIEISLLKSHFMPAFQAYKKRPRKSLLSSRTERS